MSTELNSLYSRKEERLNIYTHGFGLVASIIALPFLAEKAVGYEFFWQSSGFLIYGFSLIILYASSTFYHVSSNPEKRRKLNILDHASIYVLIAGTYTPFTLVVLNGKEGWILFGLSWFFALTGIVLKLFFTGKFNKLSTIIYVLMGWQIIFAMDSLTKNLSPEGVQLLFWGGVFYTVGALTYLIMKLPYNHAIFHVFVLLGSFSHFFSVYFFV